MQNCRLNKKLEFCIGYIDIKNTNNCVPTLMGIAEFNLNDASHCYVGLAGFDGENI